MTALRFIPRVAFFAVVTRADVADAFDAFAHHARVKHVRGGGVFETGHHFGVVRERDARALGLTVIANHHGSFVVQREGALHGVVIVQRVLVVVAIDGRQRFLDVLL